MRPGISALPITACLCVLGLSACAPVEQPETAESEQAFLARIDSSRSCFTEREVRGYSAAPDGSPNQQRILLDTGLNEEFVLETFDPCNDLDFALRIAITPQGIGSMCSGDLVYITISSRTAAGTNQCTARVLGRLTPETS